jgi:hypothetical protein
MKMNLDIDIIKEFIPIEDKSSFLVFESINVHGGIIYAPYRTLLDTEKLSIPLSDYLSKKREKKINEILSCS